MNISSFRRNYSSRGRVNFTLAIVIIADNKSNLSDARSTVNEKVSFRREHRGSSDIKPDFKTNCEYRVNFSFITILQTNPTRVCHIRVHTADREIGEVRSVGNVRVYIPRD